MCAEERPPSVATRTNTDGVRFDRSEFEQNTKTYTSAVNFKEYLLFGRISIIFVFESVIRIRFNALAAATKTSIQQQ